jgi:hypothetical protein
MTQLPSQKKSGLMLASKHDARFGLPVAADEVYEPFGFWLDRRLEELVDQWLHLASPNASRRERAGRRR